MTEQAPPTLSPVALHEERLRDPALRPIARKVADGIRLDAADARALYATDDLIGLGTLADFANRRKNGDRVFFSANQHINPTNVCILRNTCTFCSYARMPNEEGHYTRSLDEVYHEAATAIGGPTTYYLLGLTYPDGVVWVSGAKDPNSCHQSWNGRFASGANLGGQLEASYDRGAWAGAETWVPPGEEILGGPCGGMHRAGRLGDERAIVPAGAVSLVVCDSSPAGSGAVTIDDPARVAQAAGVVNGLDRGRGDGSCSMLDPDAAPSDVTFVFRYAAGPPVVVRADPNCRPGVLSGRFAVDDPTSLVAYAERLLAGG